MDNEENLADFDAEVQAFVERILETVDLGTPEPARDPDAPPARKGGAGTVVPLPCLYSNNVIRDDENSRQLSAKFKAKKEEKRREKARKKCSSLSSVGNTQYDRKAAQSLFLNASELLGRGVERIAFVTLTTSANNSYWTKEGWEKARSMFRSWTGNKTGLAYVFGSGRDWCRVIEPQRRGAIHWHMLVDCGIDIRTGVDFEAFALGDYRTASPALRGMWARLRDSCKRYGFGRSSIEPIKSEKWEAAARYVGKYIGKGIRREAQELLCENVLRPDHARRVGFSAGWKVANTRFMWLESGSDWRKGVEVFADLLQCENMGELSRKVGKTWAYRNRGLIRALASGEPLERENILTLHALMGGSMSRFESEEPDPF